MEEDEIALLNNNLDNSDSSGENEVSMFIIFLYSIRFWLTTNNVYSKQKYGSFQIPDSQLQAWKKRKNSPERIDDPLPSAYQIKLSWSDINAVGNYSCLGKNERPRHSISSMLQEDIYPLYEEKHILKNGRLSCFKLTNSINNSFHYFHEPLLH